MSSMCIFVSNYRKKKYYCSEASKIFTSVYLKIQLFAKTILIFRYFCAWSTQIDTYLQYKTNKIADVRVM
jgi:hypothetical protein